MAFEYEPKQEYLQYIEKQRNDKEQNKLDSRVQRLMDEQEDIREFKMRLVYDLKQKN
jgi:ubiquitin C-terminal hydrolase